MKNNVRCVQRPRDAFLFISERHWSLHKETLKRHKLMLFCINSVLLVIGIQKLINTVYILSSYIFFLAVLIFLHIFCFHLMLLHQFAIILYPFY